MIENDPSIPTTILVYKTVLCKMQPFSPYFSILRFLGFPGGSDSKESTCMKEM